jgi:hypothetical protein
MALDIFFRVFGEDHISLLRFDSFSRSPSRAHRLLFTSVERLRDSGDRLATVIEARRFALLPGSFHANATAHEREQERRGLAQLAGTNGFPQFSHAKCGLSILLLIPSPT